MLGADENERQRFRDECLTVKAIGAAVGISPSKISENYLGSKCTRRIPRPHQLLYKLCKGEGMFGIFEGYAHSLSCPITSKDAEAVYQGLLARYLIPVRS